MRPLKLTMSAFGPYAGVTEIDFDALGRSGVYLVCGDTGSGKTMIFDALCFALFGETSGDVRGGARSTSSLRSDYAEITAKTEVELLFEYRGKRYRIRRNPDYMRAKARGTGQTRQHAEAEMTLADGGVVSGVRKVNAQVEQLLGIDCEQFKQIVMLAQGEFRKLLTADTETREAIFRKLFGTQMHEEVQDRLAQECHMLERDNSRVKTQVLTLAGQATFPEGSQVAADFEERRTQSGQLGPWLREALEAQLRVDEPEHARLDAEVEDLRAKWSDASALLKQVANRPAVEAELACLKEEVAQLEEALPSLGAAFESQQARDPEREELAARVARIEGTYGKYEELREAVKRLADADDAAIRARESLEHAEAEQGRESASCTQLEGQIAQLEGADIRLAQAQAAYDAATQRAEAARKSLEDAIVLQDKEKAATKAAEALVGMREAHAHAAAAESEQGKAVAQTAELLASLADAEVVLSERRAAFERAQRAVFDAKAAEERRKALAADHEQAQAPYRAKLNELKAREDAYDKDAQILQDLQKRQRLGRAGLLAAELAEGCPCPVCGSTSHPAPADAAGEIPTDAQIDAAMAREAASKAEATSASLSAEKLRAVYEEKGRALASFEEEHGDADRLHALCVEAEKALSTARAERDAAVVRMGQAEDARHAHEKAQERHAHMKELLAQAEQALIGAREREVAAAHAVRALRETLGAIDVQTARASREEAMQALDDARTTCGAAKRDADKLARMQREFTFAQQRRMKAQEQLDAAQAAVQQSAADKALAEERVGRLRGDVEFASLEAAKGEVERLRGDVAKLKAARDAAEKAVRGAESSLGTKRELVKASIRQLKAIPAVDVEATKAQMQAFMEQGNALKVQASALKTRIDANSLCLSRLKAALTKAGDIEARYGRVKLLADAATGNLVGKAKIRFEAYVQAIYFDKVIEAANERLKMLTSGQFELERHSEGGGNAKAGLGLYVVDGFTGRARDASSLSGGESFQASLCLALGLSDIVQAHAGGIEFDTMFVDEGFGSLDTGALGNAISLLSDLSGGSKLVGIISHVEDLKANIPKKVVVTKSRAGSSVHLDL